MKRRTLCFLLGAEAVALVLLTLLTESYPALLSSLAAVPFEPLGAGLRALSLTGRAGNGAALALLTGLSLLPLAPVLAHGRDKSRRGENAALVIAALLLPPVLGGMANPALLRALLPGGSEAMLPVIKAVLSVSLWSVLVCWAVLRLLRLFRAGGTQSLCAFLHALLCALCALFTGVIALSCTDGLIGALRSVQRPADGVMAVLRFAADALPYGADIAVTLSAMTLLERLRAGEREAAAAAAQRLARLCCRALAAVTGGTAALNLLQLALARQLSQVTAGVSIPLMSLAFVLAALLLARLIAENGRLADENDAFI